MPGPIRRVLAIQRVNSCKRSRGICENAEMSGWSREHKNFHARFSMRAGCSVLRTAALWFSISAYNTHGQTLSQKMQRRRRTDRTDGFGRRREHSARTRSGPAKPTSQPAFLKLKNSEHAKNRLDGPPNLNGRVSNLAGFLTKFEVQSQTRTCVSHRF